MTDPVFFEPARRLTVEEAAQAVGAVLADAALGGIVIQSVAPVFDAVPGSICFVEGKANAQQISSTRASAVICKAEFAPLARPGVAVLIAERPQAAFAAVVAMLLPGSIGPSGATGEAGIAPGAHVAATATIEAGATVEAGAVIGAGAAVGSGTVICANAVIGANCQVGRDCHIGPNASVLHALIGNRVTIHGGVRIGQDGFGFFAGPTGPAKMPQVGRVVVQDDVEIGANSTIDRGALGDTVIGETTKIDNMVHIAHNVRVGRGCLIAGQCGISGSVTIGNYVMLGGRVGIKDHVSIGDGAQIAAGSGLMFDVPAGTKWAGSPAFPVREHFRQVATLKALAADRSRKG